MESIPSRASDGGPDAASPVCPNCGETDAFIVTCATCDKLICTACSVRWLKVRYCEPCGTAGEEASRDFSDWIFEINYQTRWNIGRFDSEETKTALLAELRRLVDRAEQVL